MGSNPKTNISANQVLQKCYDETNDRLRVDAAVTATLGDVRIDAEESDIAVKDRVTDNLLKINADGSIDANVIVSAASGDSIQVSDGTDTLAVNPDGSINVNVVSTAAGTTVNTYNEISSVSSSVLSTVVSYTAPSTTKLMIIEVGGTNISRYDILLNSSVIARKYTSFGSGLNGEFNFKDGLMLAMGDVVEVKTIHSRPSTGDFNGRIQVVEL